MAAPRGRGRGVPLSTLSAVPSPASGFQPDAILDIPTETEDEDTDLNDETDQSNSGAPKISAAEMALSEELRRQLAEAGRIARESQYELKETELELVEHVDEPDSDEGLGNIYATEFMAAFAPLRYFIYWTFPFKVVKSGENSYTFTASMYPHLGGMGFLFSTFLATVLFLLTWLGMFSYFLNVPKQTSTGTSGNGTSSWNGRAEEIFLLHRNFPTFIVFLTSLFHVVVGNYQFFKKRVEIAEYLTFWTEALQIMKIHSAKGIFFPMMCMCGVFASFLLILLTMGWIVISPIVTGGPGFVAHIVMRIFVLDFFTLGDIFALTRAAFGLIFIYIFFASKIYVFLYIFQCMVMRTTFKKWSERLDHVVNRNDDFTVRGNRLGKRTGFKELYQDHVVLLDLIDGADMMFGETIESYFTATTFSICFECFYLWRSLTNREEFPPERAMDALVVGLYLLQSLVIMFTAASLSADVADTAMEALEVLRRKGFFGRKSGEELYFLMSLYSSYAGAEVTAITGGGYFVLDQSFLVVIMGTFLSYVIILFQFNPPMEFKDDRLVPLILDRDMLLHKVEGNITSFTG